MSHDRNAQQWVLLGTAEASNQVWGLREINFPCGYMMPPGSFATSASELERPREGEVWAMAGFAIELARGGKLIDKEASPEHLAGYRPWISVFHDALLDELQDRAHTIEMWDKGLSIFHGLWRESCQYLGDLIPVSDFEALTDIPLTIQTGGNENTGQCARDYTQKAPEIINFMSQFMTLSTGDIWVQGPLVASKLSAEETQFVCNFGSQSITAKVN